MLSSVREAPYRSSSNAGHLRGLEWAIGELLSTRLKGGPGHWTKVQWQVILILARLARFEDGLAADRSAVT